MDMVMNNKSRKQKGRRLQNYVRDNLLKTFPHLKAEDVQVAIINEPGPDIKLSRIAKKLIPYQFECKNQEKMKTLYQWFKQAKKHGNEEPILVCKQNTKEELAVINFKHLLELIK
tara:strand:+ start:1522 stop:1866 length:345 start_codon:yes stop_codon:yes gene_type:complete